MDIKKTNTTYTNTHKMVANEFSVCLYACFWVHLDCQLKTSISSALQLFTGRVEYSVECMESGHLTFIGFMP